MGLLDKARYYRMGFRDKARYWLTKWGMLQESPINQKEDQLANNNILNYDTNTQKILERKIHDVNTLFEISKELNSSLDIDDLLEIILLTCMGQMGLEYIAILIKNQSIFSINGQRGLDELNIENLIIESDNDFIKFLNDNNTILSIDEINQKFLNNKVTDIFKMLKAQLIVPLIAKGNINGLLSLGPKMNKEIYTQEEKDFLFMLASMAGIAVENAMLYSNLKKANIELDKNYKELSTLYEISKIINSSGNLEEVLKLALETMSTGFGVEIASICLYNESNEMTINASIGLSEKTKEKFIIKNDNAIFSLLMENMEPEKFDDFKSINEIKNLFDNNDLQNINLFIAIPLLCSEQKLGLLNIHKINRTDNNDINNNEKDLKLFSLFASQIAPPILSTKILNKKVIKKFDFYSNLADWIQTNIELAKDFGISLTLLILKIQGANNLEEEENAILIFIDLLNKILKEGQTYYRISKNRFIIILPNFSQNELFNFINIVKNQLKKEKEWVILEFSTINYPEDGVDSRELLFKIE